MRRPWWRRFVAGCGWAVLGFLGNLLLLTVLLASYVAVSSGTVAPPSLDANGHEVRAGGLTTHYEQWGTQGSPIVLVHGFLESTYAWGLVGPRLAAAGHRVYAIDVRGFGYTERVGPYTLTSDTDQLAAFLTALHLDASHNARPVLVGHSSGAAIIGNLARLHPEAVAAVAFVDGDGTPYGVGPAWIHSLVVDPYATALIRWNARHPTLPKLIYESSCAPGCPPFEADAWTRPLRVAGAESALKSILSQPLIGMTYEQERSIRVPAAVIYGTKDDSMSAADARDTAERLHTTLVVPLQGQHHLVMLSDPAGTTAAILRLVSR